MSNVAVRVEGLSKRYQLGGAQGGYHTIRESLTELFRRPLDRWGADREADTGTGELWALKDVSFDVPHGQVLGIIGRNGAGKSTLLKILSRITEPTSGRAEVAGRVGSLLEVGTGFHPELTGRENVFLNGAILGMPRSEIRRRFDEIVAFAEVERFLDTPVKRYSSGMYMRLAFSVAAHLEPDVLVVDEVLAVGDAEFQRKCMGKMGATAEEGRTVLFVSHNLDAVRSLSSECLMLAGGRVAHQGAVHTVIAEYMRSFRQADAQTDLLRRVDRAGSGDVRLAGIRFVDDQGRPVRALKTGETGKIAVDLVSSGSADLSNVAVTMAIVSGMGLPLTLQSNMYTGEVLPIEAGRVTVECTIPRLPFAAGSYRIDLGVKTGATLSDHIIAAEYLEVEPGDFFPTGQHPPAQFPVYVDASWACRPNRSASER